LNAGGVIVMKNRVYFDNGASTQIDPKVLDAMIPFLKNKYGNASSIHSLGVEAKEALEKSRKLIAESINAKPEEVVFTSGGTESNNFALKSIAFSNRKKGNHIIVTKIEHDCILNSCKWLEEQGFKITYLNVNNEGFVLPEELNNAITKKTILVSIIHGQNEIGTIQNLKQLGKICREKNVYFHTDACQSFTKTELDVKKQNLDLITLNAHKIHGPKGVGALYIRHGVKIRAWQHGGGHEFGKRSGTENIPGIVGFAEAVKQAKPEHIKHMIKLRNKLIKGILDIPGSRLNGPLKERLCNNTNFAFEGVEGESLVGMLDLKGICASTGSACASKKLESSHVLKAIGVPASFINGSLRLTISRFNTYEEVDYFLKIFPDIIKKLRNISSVKVT